MTLLRLSPDGDRLRRIAKAHAAGELSTLNYRRIRSEVIEGFADAAAEGNVTGDTTQRRWRDRGKPRPARHDPARAAAPQGAQRPRLVWLMLAALLVAILLGAAAAWGKAAAPLDAQKGGQTALRQA